MDVNQVAVRLAQAGLSEEEKQAVRNKLAAGSINPNSWNFLNDLELAESLRNLIQQAASTQPVPAHTEELIEIKSRLAILEEREFVKDDERLTYFSRVVRSAGKHSKASAQIRQSAIYGGRCAFCQSSTFITTAHIVAGANDIDYSAFSDGYESPLDVKSARNFLPLCGTLGSYGTCYNEFNKYRITLLYRPLAQVYTIFCLDLADSPKADLHNRDINVDPKFPPYRRLLAWRTRKCILEYSSKMPDKGSALFELAKFSDSSISVAADSDSENVSDSEDLNSTT